MTMYDPDNEQHQIYMEQQRAYWTPERVAAALAASQQIAAHTTSYRETIALANACRDGLTPAVYDCEKSARFHAKQEMAA